MVDRERVLERLDEERRHLARDGEVIEVLPKLTRLTCADGALRSVIYSRFGSAEADAIIENEIGIHRRMGAGCEWKVYAHDQPANLRERLVHHGFSVGSLEAVLVLDLAKHHDWMDGVDTTGIVRIERLEQIADFKRAAEVIFEKDYTLTATDLASAIRSGSTQHRGYVAYADGRPVSIGRLYTHPQSWFGGLYGGGTIPEFRSRGHYRQLVAARARDAIASGSQYLIVDALPTSRPILERLGFEWITDTCPCEWTISR